MRVVLESGWRRVELVDQSEQAAAGSMEQGASRNCLEFAHAEAAAACLRQYQQDDAVIAAIRSLLQSQSGAARSGLGTAAEVIQQAALLIAQGRLRVFESSNTRRPLKTSGPPPAAPPPESSAPAGPPENSSPATKPCSNPACQPAFQEAAATGQPVVQRQSSCGC